MRRDGSSVQGYRDKLLDNHTISKVIGCPIANVEANWPSIRTCLQSLNQWSANGEVAALATIGIECPPFKPIHEYGTDARAEKLYGHRKDLGNVHDGDGWRYAGRGFVQITGGFNYKHYGDLLGIDMLDDPNDPNDDKDPDKALTTHVAASIFAAYFMEHKVMEAADAGDWKLVRKRVNGGLNGYDVFKKYVDHFLLAQKGYNV